MRPKALRSREDADIAQAENAPAPVAAILPFVPPQDRTNRSVLSKQPFFFFVKRVMDITGAALLLFLLLPLLFGVAVAIKLTSDGPILFRQQRYGLGNRLFTIYKFRTMTIDAQDISGVKQACHDDPRLTSIGGFLRRSSLDELPQILNVLKGEMSLVGPRPHVPGMLAGGILYEELVPQYFQRHAIKPGVTGLAQIHGLRGPTQDPVSAKRRIQYDLRYIQTASLRLDVVILWKTFIREMFGRNGV